MKGLETSWELGGPRNRIALVRLVGFVDTNTVAQLSQIMNQITNAGHYKIIFDLGDVNYISSAGWGIFIGEIREIRERDGDIKLACLTPEVEEVYKVLEFDTILQAYQTVDEAIQDFA